MVFVPKKLQKNLSETEIPFQTILIYIFEGDASTRYRIRGVIACLAMWKSTVSIIRILGQTPRIM